MTTNTTVNTPEAQAAAETTPTNSLLTRSDLKVAEDGNSVEAGFTEADALGPSDTSADDDKSNATLLAGKYKTPEELEKAYKELEAKLGGKQSGDEAAKQNYTGPRVAGLETTEEATSLLQEKGLDITTFTAEFEHTGQLSPDSYAKLEQHGISRDMVNAYIDGQRVLVESQVTEVKNAVGGEAAYSQLATWAVSNLSDSEQRAYGKILESNDLAAIKLAAQGLKAKYDAAMGKDPQVVVGGHAAGGGNDGMERFASRAEMVTAMQDPRYGKDPAYRAWVERKVINSSF